MGNKGSGFLHMISEKIIKNDFLDLENEHPFKSSDYFEFFKFKRHNHFTRFLDNPKYYRHLKFDVFRSKVNSRISETISFDRYMFLTICEKKRKDSDKHKLIYNEYHRKNIIRETEHFPYLKKGQPHNLYLYNRPAGKYYNHSLSTINLAKALMINPYKLFEFCVTELAWQHDAASISVSNPYNPLFKEQIPYLCYDSLCNDERLSYLNLIRLVIEDFKLTEFQKRLGKFYYDQIKILLGKQVAIEHKKRFYAERRAKATEFVFYDKALLRSTHREGAKLFHPDKNPEGLELFKRFNNLYMKRDRNAMEKMITNYKNKMNGNPS